MSILWHALLVGWALAVPNGLGRVPQMGYNSWYDLMGNLNEENLKATVDAMVKLGLPELGYNYFNLDDDWADGRYPNGTVYAIKSKFPSKTLKPLADYVHSKNLLFGTYTDRGTQTCGGHPGALGHEKIDANTYAEWGVDYLKEDSCHASSDHSTAFKEYGAMRDALNGTGRPIFFSLCGWNTWYSPVGSTLGNSWRIGPDDTTWHNVLVNIDMNAPLFVNAGPDKGWNDPCLLLSNDLNNKPRITELQTRTQFNMWAVMASPLLISGNLRNISDFVLETYKNTEVIGVSQDKLGHQGERIAGGDLAATPAVSLSGCDSSDPAQQFELGSNGYWCNKATKKCLDVDDCKTKLIMWPPVTNGCSENKGFYFNFTDDHQLKSALGGCVQAGYTLNLHPCDKTPQQQWSYDATTKLITSGEGQCITTSAGTTTNVWARSLTGGRWAFVFINVGESSADITCDKQCFDATTLKGVVHYRDVWLHKDLGSFTAGNFVAKDVGPNGGSVMYIFSPAA